MCRSYGASLIIIIFPFYKDVAPMELTEERYSAIVSWLFVALSATIKQSQAQRANIFVALRSTAKSKSPSGAIHCISQIIKCIAPMELR
jgi:hypothetical protein